VLPPTKPHLHPIDRALFLPSPVFRGFRAVSSSSSWAGMRPAVRSGWILRSLGEDGLELSMGVSPGRYWNLPDGVCS